MKQVTEMCGQMKERIRQFDLKKVDKMAVLEALFMAFCFMPFILPNPIVTTNIQPYAAGFGALIILLNVTPKPTFRIRLKSFTAVAALTTAAAFVVLFVKPITLGSFRALYNYCAVGIIPMATMLMIRRRKKFPETACKVLILIWLAVACIQFFVYRGFATEIIGGVRWSKGTRGVVGLASEPSFLGIVCFYFLHVVQKFKEKKQQLLFMAAALVMGVFFAYSAVGLVFIGGFMLAYLADLDKGKLRTAIWGGMAAVVVGFVVALNTVLKGTRIYKLINMFMTGGFDALLKDASASTRLRAMVNAIDSAFDNFLLPQGYGSRIGSGYGGFLCELGFLALPIMILISLAMCLTFRKKGSRILYFLIVTFLLFNNTQIGNPLLLFVVGSNLAVKELAEMPEEPHVPERRKKKSKKVEKEIIKPLPAYLP